MLLAAGAKPDESAMYQAGWLNEFVALGLLLDAGGDPNLALHGAAHGGHAKAMKLLLDRGADPNVKSKHGSTPLHGANGSEIVQLLLARMVKKLRRAIFHVKSPVVEPLLATSLAGVSSCLRPYQALFPVIHDRIGYFEEPN